MIESTANPKVRLAREVRAGKHRDLLLVEGERGVLEAARAGLAFEVLLASPETRSLLDDSLPPDCPRPLAAAPALLDSLSDLDSPRDAIGVVGREFDPAAGLPSGWRLAVYADRVQDPVNLGALARVSAGAGVDALLTSTGCAHPNHHRAVRASAYSLLTLPVIPDVGWDRLGAIASGAQKIGLDPRGEASIYNLAPQLPSVVVIGGEMGIHPDHLRTLTTARIPMPGEVESLNLAVAAGIALFEWVHRFEAKES